MEPYWKDGKLLIQDGAGITYEIPVKKVWTEQDRLARWEELKQKVALNNDKHFLLEGWTLEDFEVVYGPIENFTYRRVTMQGTQP